MELKDVQDSIYESLRGFDLARHRFGGMQEYQLRSAVKVSEGWEVNMAKSCLSVFHEVDDYFMEEGLDFDTHGMTLIEVYENIMGISATDHSEKQVRDTVSRIVKSTKKSALADAGAKLLFKLF